MATRKLKFKPKPLVGGSIRRAREKDDLSQEANIPEKVTPLPSEECIGNSTITYKNENLIVNKEDNISNNSNVLNNLKTKQSEFDTSLPDNSPLSNNSVDVDCNLIINKDDASSVSNSQSSIEDVLTRKQIPPTTQEELVSNSSTCNNSDFSTCIIAKRTDVTVVENFPIKNSTVCDTSSNKLDLVKGIPRFGRSRCKPVLNNLSLRKKNDVVNSEIILNSVNVRTESVIKSLKLEQSKPKSVVEEITESFSLLESDEPEAIHIEKPLSKTQTIESTKVNSDNDKLDILQSDSAGDFYKCSNSKGKVFTDPILIDSEINTSSCSNVVIKLSKNNESKEIEQINENNGEVLNTNIVSPLTFNKVPTLPLRTPPKVLAPKPSPRISDVTPRKISFQGSDSEDETKWKNPFSANSEISKTTNKDKTETNIKSKKRKRSQGPTFSKMGQDTLEKFVKKFGKNKTPDKAKLTMIDLIFYNPKNNPMTVNQQIPGIRKKEENLEVNETVEEVLAEQSVDDVEPTVMPVPQLKVGPDGQIMLDPQSLVIEITGMEKNRAELEKSEIIQDTGVTRYSTYSKKKPKRNEWSSQETLQFYKALNTIGSDFALMAKLFPKRNRHDLKLKFKREEKANMHLIDKAMTAPSDFDFKSLENEIKLENEATERKILQKAHAAEAKKKERALKKEEKLKAKDSIKPPITKFTRKRDSAFRDFNETDVGKIHRPKYMPKKRRTRKRRACIEDDLIDPDLEEELQIDLDLNSEEEDEGIKIVKIVKETRSGRLPKPSAKLEEYEEIHESLKQKLHHESDSEEDLYSPNGPDAHMLFGNPNEVPTNEAEERQWNIEIHSLPTIEDTVLLNDNIEDVSELSELGSFGQNDTALDLSMPVRTNIQRELLEERQTDSSLLNRHLISESIQIIDQLTSNVEHNNMYVDEDIVEEKIIEDIPNKEVQIYSKIPLPSFESVSRSRPSMKYPLQAPYIDTDSNHENGVQESSNEQSIVLSNYFNEDGECILGE